MEAAATSVSTGRLWILAFVTYCPPPDFFTRLGEVLKAAYPVIVLENTPMQSPGFEAMMPCGHLTLLHENSNLGLGTGLNRLMKKADELGYAHVLYFDQDTIFSLTSLQFINTWMMLHGATMKPCSAVQFKTVEAASPTVEGLHYARLLISSGSMFVIENLAKLGWHDPAFFVEGVDYKFCLDSVSNGFKLSEVTHCPGIDHESPQPGNRLKIFGREYTYRLYPQHRQKQFFLALARLGGIALKRGNVLYACIFFRNILTFVLTQGWYSVLSLMKSAGNQST